MEASTAPITKVVQHYYPDWQPPRNEQDWNQCLCPAHEEEHPSCSVNFEVGGIRCMACGFKGDVTSIIRRREGISHNAAVKRAEELLGSSYKPVSKKHGRKSRRRVFSV